MTIKSVTKRTTRATEICKFPITSFRGFTFPADNEFINSHPTPVFLSRTNVFNRYSCLYNKSNCSHNDKDRFVRRKFKFHVNRNPSVAYPNVQDRFDSCMDGWKRALRESFSSRNTSKEMKEQETMALTVLTSYLSVILLNSTFFYAAFFSLFLLPNVKPARYLLRSFYVNKAIY